MRKSVIGRQIVSAVLVCIQHLHPCRLQVGAAPQSCVKLCRLSSKPDFFKQPYMSKATCNQLEDAIHISSTGGPHHTRPIICHCVVHHMPLVKDVRVNLQPWTCPYAGSRSEQVFLQKTLRQLSQAQLCYKQPAFALVLLLQPPFLQIAGQQKVCTTHCTFYS